MADVPAYVGGFTVSLNYQVQCTTVLLSLGCKRSHRLVISALEKSVPFLLTAYDVARLHLGNTNMHLTTATAKSWWSRGHSAQHSTYVATGRGSLVCGVIFAGRLQCDLKAVMAIVAL